MRIRIGTRESQLAIAQATEVKLALAAFTEATIELVPIKTTGDKIQGKPLAQIGGKGLFTKELEEALLGGCIEMAVHSMKDMPAFAPPGLLIGAILPREDPRDAYLGRAGLRLEDLPQGAQIGTSSVRRQAQLLAKRPDLQIVPLRGNVITRLQKLAAGPLDATVMACAGLRRLQIDPTLYTPLPASWMLPAVAQGAIGVQYNQNNQQIAELLAHINHQYSATLVAAERGFLEVLDGSCRTPLAALATYTEGGDLHLEAMVASPDGQHIHRLTQAGAVEDAVSIGRDIGKQLQPILVKYL